MLHFKASQSNMHKLTPWYYIDQSIIVGIHKLGNMPCITNRCGKHTTNNPYIQTIMPYYMHHKHDNEMSKQNQGQAMHSYVMSITEYINLHTWLNTLHAKKSLNNLTN